ncbi:MAG: hypothetical protein ACLFUQ_06370 [Candidatus Izemoplasmataceae bacterium]
MMKKIIISGALVLFIFTFSFRLFAEWDSVTAHRHELELNGFYIEDVSTTYAPGQNLVPEGSILTQGDVDRITYTYDVLAYPDQSVTSEFESLVLETKNGEVSDDHDLFNIETEVLDRETLDDTDCERLKIEATITLKRPENAEEDEFLSEIRQMSFDLTLNDEE